MQKTFDKALALHQQNKIVEARALYYKILDKSPQHAQTLNLVGVTYLQQADYAQALEYFNKAIKSQPDFAQAYVNRGLALQQAQHFSDALASLDKAISIAPQLAEAHNRRGDILLHLGQLDSARHSYQTAITLNPNQPEAHFNLGNTYNRLNDIDAALASYKIAISLRPDFSEAFYKCGNIYTNQKRADNAIACYTKAIQYKPDFAEAYCHRGNALKHLTQLDAALADFDKAIEYSPRLAEAHFGHGQTLQTNAKLDLALESLNTAIDIKADYAEAYHSRGVIFDELSNIDAALNNYNTAIELKPDYAEAYSNRGLIYQKMMQLDAALADFDRSIVLAPDFAHAHWNKSLALLLIGDFEYGWEEYEWRHIKNAAISKREFNQPQWTGEQDLTGKTLLIHIEQGLGDSIQFSRYLSLFSDMDCTVILELNNVLRPLLDHLPGVDVVTTEQQPAEAYDYHCPIMSLPLAFRTRLDTIPSSEKYLEAKQDKIDVWAEKLGPKTRPRIGLVWSGNANHKNDSNRSIALNELLDQLPTEYQYISLQKEVRESDQDTLQSSPRLIHYGSELGDFTDTAALCELLDIIISVDTSVAHLSAALGKRTWVLIPFSPDWRWLTDRTDSPWYPSMTLYRQEEIGNWDSPLHNINTDLKSLMTATQ